MPAEPTYVIVGASMAGAKAAETLREEGFGGSIVLEDQGQIGGDAAVFGGGVRLDRNVKVGGDVSVFGGQVRRDPSSVVGGDITNFHGAFWMILIFALPLILLGGILALIVLLVRRMTRRSVPASTTRTAPPTPGSSTRSCRRMPWPAPPRPRRSGGPVSPETPTAARFACAGAIASAGWPKPSRPTAVGPSGHPAHERPRRSTVVASVPVSPA